MFSIDPAVFRPDAVSAETRALNADIIQKLAAGPDPWTFTPAEIRARRAAGRGPFPLAPRSDHARTLTIDGPAGPLDLRLIAPDQPRGVYLHMHGGGWTVGTAADQDPRLERLAENCGLACLSIEYRLAPEHPYPAGPDDCEAAALWLAQNAKSEFGTDQLMIGGESAGAHLSVVTLLRLRDRHGLTPFSKANLVAGCYDMAMTPSARTFGDEPLILRTKDIRNFRRCFVGDDADYTDPDISPIHADLTGLPLALFSIGTRDALLDDSLFMAQRWLTAGNATEIAVFPGGPHVFQGFDCALAEESLTRMDAFLGAED